MRVLSIIQVLKLGKSWAYNTLHIGNSELKNKVGDIETTNCESSEHFLVIKFGSFVEMAYFCPQNLILD